MSIAWPPSRATPIRRCSGQTWSSPTERACSAPADSTRVSCRLIDGSFTVEAVKE
jgi:hypothetical protein